MLTEALSSDIKARSNAKPAGNFLMDANARWDYALQQPCAQKVKRSQKSVKLQAGGTEWRRGARPTITSARDKFSEESIASRNFQRAASLEQSELDEKRRAARAFDQLSCRQVEQVARGVEMKWLVASWQYACALQGMAMTEADGWLEPAAAAAMLAEMEAELRVMSERANALAALERQEIERLGQEARTKEQYAKVERTIEVKADVAVEGLPGWFEALTDFRERLAAIKANKLGDWEEFNAWLRTEYDEEDLAEFTFEDEEDIEIYTDFRAKRKR